MSRRRPRKNKRDAAVLAEVAYMGDHAWFVAAFATEVARLMGLREEEVDVVRQAAFLHDVGKVAIPDSILKKQGPLDEDELETMREHSVLGARLVGSIPGLAHLAPVVRATHERWDGEGYPDGLSGEEIPLASRIVHACDYSRCQAVRPRVTPGCPRHPLVPARAFRRRAAFIYRNS